MFCPKCGKAEQLPETYCRQCGIFLPDLSKPLKSNHTPEEHVKANAVLSSMTIVTCFTLVILLWSMLAVRDDTHPLIYVTAGLLFAMGIWHIQTLWRILLLKKHIMKNKRPQETLQETGTASTGKLLDQADFESVVPASVTENTTRHLAEKTDRSSQPKH